MTKPVDKLNVENIQISIWENRGQKGAFRTATIQLRYQDKESGEWKNGKNFGERDLENLETAAREARERIRKFKADTGSKPAP